MLKKLVLSFLSLTITMSSVLASEAATAVGESSSYTAEQAFLEARDLQKRKDYGPASHIFLGLSALGNVKAMHNLGVIEYEQGRYPHARFWFQRAGLDPSQRNLERMRSQGHWPTVPEALAAQLDNAPYRWMILAELSRETLATHRQVSYFWLQQMGVQMSVDGTPLTVLDILSDIKDARARALPRDFLEISGPRYLEARPVSNEVMKAFGSMASILLLDVAQVETFAHEISDMVFDARRDFLLHDQLVKFYNQRKASLAFMGKINHLYSEERARQYLQRILSQLSTQDDYAVGLVALTQSFDFKHNARYSFFDGEYGPVEEERRSIYPQKAAEVGPPFIKLYYAEQNAKKGQDPALLEPIWARPPLGCGHEPTNEPCHMDEEEMRLSSQTYDRVSSLIFPERDYGQTITSSSLFPDLLRQARKSFGRSMHISPTAMNALRPYITMEDAFIDPLLEQGVDIMERERDLIRRFVESGDIECIFDPRRPYYCDDERNSWYERAVHQIIEEEHPEACEYYRALVAGGGWVPIGHPFPEQMVMVKTPYEGRFEAPYTQRLEDWLLHTGRISEPLRFTPMQDIVVQENDALSDAQQAVLTYQLPRKIKGFSHMGSACFSREEYHASGHLISSEDGSFAGNNGHIFRRSVKFEQSHGGYAEIIFGAPVFIKTETFSCFGNVRFVPHNGCVVVAEKFEIDPEAMILGADKCHFIRVPRVDLSEAEPFRISRPATPPAIAAGADE